MQTIIRRTLIALGVVRRHVYAQPAAGYVAWLTGPLGGVVGFEGVTGDVTVTW